MKTKLLSLFFTLIIITSIQAQETTVNLSMGANYSNQVFYKLSTDTQTSVAANSWDIAMLRTGAFDIGLRVNQGAGIDVFEASNNPADWNSIDITNEGSWATLYNSETSWYSGALDQGSAYYGWGEYNPANHHVSGTIIFVFKYTDGTYIKFINEDFYGGYTFKYSIWNADTSTWEADQTATVPNGTSDVSYNYFSLLNNQSVTVAPADSDWDIKFTKYPLDYYGDGTVYYPVTGVLHNDLVEVAENNEPGGMPVNPSLTFSSDINVIGSDWKSFGGTGYTVDSDKAFYVKYTDDTVYRLYFTTFEGSSTGNITFNYENVTESLDMEEVTQNISFGVYPNPSLDKKINLIYDIDRLSANVNEVSIYSTTGQKVFESSLKKNLGFYNQVLDLNNLSAGIYMLQFTSGDYSITKKIILK